MNKPQSIEPLIADKFNNELRSYNLEYKLEQESLNKKIDEALKNYASKSGGLGGNRPDVKLLLNTQDPNRRVPILIEYKGLKDKLIKLDKNKLVENFKNHEPHYKNIREYALNGALHYANAILHHTSYTECIAIGITGYKDDKGGICSQIAVYYVNKSNLGMGVDVSKGEQGYNDLSFLSRKHFNDFIKRVDTLSLSDEDLERIREKKNQEIEDCLTDLNNTIYNKEKDLSEKDRMYLVVASIIANLGIPNFVTPLNKEYLKSSDEVHQRDGDIMLRKIQSFLEHKHLPQEKKQSIISSLEPLLRNENNNKAINGESRLKRCFSEIVDSLGVYYKIGLSTDFTGKLFNEMYRWLGFTQDKLNDVVLTPPYAATLLARLSKVNKDSFVWDFATGSAGLLVASMNLMIEDAKKCITSPEELEQKIVHIKAKQLLGIEIKPDIHILAVLNMILMGDGSSQILNQDSLSGFDGKVNNEEFKANAFVLNPPYSASGKGMVFVEQALEKMQSGYASVIIQSSAGSGKAKEYNVRILEKHTLLASIKMPLDLFIGKSSVQTHIYVFRVNEKHDAKQRVKFINFSNDGYARANRKKAKASHNLKDTHNAKERYNEVVDLVHIGKSCLKFLSEDDYYENTIDPKNGSDWNQNKPTETKPELEDFKRTIADYLSYEVGLILKDQTPPK
ncbi:N-6 DNA methylase [Helicobacter pylori]|uniref:VRR-NUC domain-containing protein n=1 Tax=Helicobacter pylori TaxID=210 RepID=UPI000D368CCA|nr:N-6 DNA methylase [Helicobacter pylori]PUD51051.1 restriction endonuclease subunit M [Helicobacter pylori]WRG72630.1 N-6 DNA methylase [Helicobacter pylori]WRG78332.1 N-6 DNA methylase [Helicobacter pylori]